MTPIDPIGNKLLAALVAISNNSKLTQDVHEAITARLTTAEKNDLLLWINKLVKPNIEKGKAR